jgi:hypothetical protein
MEEQLVYLLWHEYLLLGHDEEKLLGVFSERHLAEESQRYFETQPGFRDHLEGLRIHECKLNERLWSEGFVTFNYPLQDTYPTS